MADDRTASPDLRSVFDRQYRASRMEAALDLRSRLEALGRLRGLVVENRAAIAAAISQDFGNRSPSETDLLEIVPTLGAIGYARRQLAGWMKPQRRSVHPAFQPARPGGGWPPWCHGPFVGGDVRFSPMGWCG